MNDILTIQNAETEVPGFVKNEVDSRITKLRPMATPVDQISRFSTPRPVKSMKVDYYAVAMRGFETKTMKPLAQTNLATSTSDISLTIADESVFEVSETVMLDGILGPDNEPMIFYVTSIDRSEGKINLRPLNPMHNNESDTDFVPQIPMSTRIIRMGRAAGELDVQTGQYETLPTKKENFCQIFKTQIEQSTLMSQTNKEVGWTLSDQEEVAVFDMRLGMERSFLFGHKAVIVDPAKKCEVYFTGGIWNQAGKEAEYLPDELDAQTWTHIMATAFTGHDGSKRKILIGGTRLIERIANMAGGQQRVLLPENKVSRWGLDFTEIVSKFGTLYVIHSEVMDSCGHADDGLIIDPEYLTKYVHTPFKAESLDLRTSGQRNTEAVVMTEISCLVLRYPEAHCRIKMLK